MEVKLEGEIASKPFELGDVFISSEGASYLLTQESGAEARIVLKNFNGHGYYAINNDLTKMRAYLTTNASRLKHYPASLYELTLKKK